MGFKFNPLTGQFDITDGTGSGPTPPPTGDNNTIAYFDNTGALTDNINAKFDGSINSMSFGLIATGGSILSTGNSALSFGSADTSGVILSSGIGSQTNGLATGGTLTASGIGSEASGRPNGGGHITASGIGAMARGVGGDGTISALADGALSIGSVTLNCQITATAVGAFAHGQTADAGNLRAEGIGSEAAGYGQGAGQSGMHATGVGSKAFGLSSVSISTINASGNGSIAHGVSNNNASINAIGNGSVARGQVAIGVSINASGNGSYGGGNITADLIASGSGAFAHGDAHTVSADLGTAFGIGHTSSSYSSFAIGRYALVTGTVGSWVSTEPAFVIGNGTGIGTEASAFQIDKDGKITETAANVVPIRVIGAGGDTLSARLDRKVILNSAAGTENLTLPAGEDGLTFGIGFAGTSNVAVWTLVPNGADAIDASLSAWMASPVGTGSATFITGAWYLV